MEGDQIYMQFSTSLREAPHTPITERLGLIVFHISLFPPQWRKGPHEWTRCAWTADLHTALRMRYGMASIHTAHHP
jgi:hypothetical protein